MWDIGCPTWQSQKVHDGIMYSLGVTGFDGLFFERRATQCTSSQHLKLEGNQTCQENSCKRNVTILRYEGLCVRVRDSLTALRLRDISPVGFLQP